MYTTERKRGEQMPERKSPGREASLRVTGMGKRAPPTPPHVILHPFKALTMNTCFYTVNVMRKCLGFFFFFMESEILLELNSGKARVTH